MSGPIWFYGGKGEAAEIAGAPALEVHKLNIAYPDSTEILLRDLEFSFAAGTCNALVGHNGAGKSTLLKAIIGLHPVINGEIKIYGLEPGACHHRVAYLAQRDALNWSFPATVRDVVLSGRYVHLGWLRNPGIEDKRLAEEAMTLLGMENLAMRRINRLSGGQQQRMLLARALAQQAQVLLLDEPLNALDRESHDYLSEVFQRLKKEGKTLLIATHEHDDPGCEFDNVIFLHEGRAHYRQVCG